MSPTCDSAYADRVAEAERLALPAGVDVGELAGAAHGGEPLEVALLLQPGLHVGAAVEVVDHRRLAPTGDQQHVADAGGGGLLDDVLQHRPVDDRQQFLGHGLGGRQEPGGQAGGRDDGLDRPAAGRMRATVIEGAPSLECSGHAARLSAAALPRRVWPTGRRRRGRIPVRPGVSDATSASERRRRSSPSAIASATRYVSRPAALAA